MKCCRWLAFWCVCLTLFLAEVGLAGNWPQWRGLDRSGYTDEVDLPLTWDGKKQENVLWKVPADFGHSSPIVWGDRVFLSASVRKMPVPGNRVQFHCADACYRRQAPLCLVRFRGLPLPGVADGGAALLEDGGWRTSI
jgi:hypothetical protein